MMPYISFWVFIMPSDVHSCLFHTLTIKEEEMIGSRDACTETLQRSVMIH